MCSEITVCSPLTDAKRYSLDILTSSLLKQDCDLSRVSLIIVLDQKSPCASAYFDVWGGRDLLKSCTVLRTAPSLLPSSVAEGHGTIWLIAQLRQAGLNSYLKRPGDGLVWWDSDHDWDCNFLSRVTAHRVSTGVYSMRAAERLCHFLSDPKSGASAITSGMSADDPLLDYSGMGGFWAQREVWEAFAREGGWGGYVPSWADGPHRWGEDFWCCHHLPAAKLLSGVCCWHHDMGGARRYQSGEFLYKPGNAQGVKVLK